VRRICAETAAATADGSLDGGRFVAGGSARIHDGSRDYGRAAAATANGSAGADDARHTRWRPGRSRNGGREGPRRRAGGRGRAATAAGEPDLAAGRSRRRPGEDGG
jgi:hypothetical protein